MNWKRFALTGLAICALAGSLHAEAAAHDAGAHDATASTLAPDTTLTPRSPASLFTSPAPGKDNSQLVIYFVALVALVGGGFFVLKRGRQVLL